jgi:hypothetical protein
MAARRPDRVVPVKHSSGVLALSKAKAALWLLGQIEGENILAVDRPFSTPTVTCGLALDTKEVRDWLSTICLDTIADSIKEAEAAFVKASAEEVA